MKSLSSLTVRKRFSGLGFRVFLKKVIRWVRDLLVEGIRWEKPQVDELGVKILVGHAGEILAGQDPVHQVTQVIDIRMGTIFSLRSSSGVSQEP